MSFRTRAFAIHLMASLGVLLLALGVLYLGWYRWPGWYLAGAESIVGVLVLVDLCLGPLGTLVISNPRKPRAEWRRDLAAIVAVQLLAFSYGCHTLWAGRPLFYAFSLNRIEMIRAVDFKDEAIQQAISKGATILPAWQYPVRWIWARLPDNAEESAAIVYSTLFGGDDVVVMPQHFRPWDDARADMSATYVDMARVSRHLGWSDAEYRRRLDELNRASDELGVLPVKGSHRDGAWVLDRKTAQPLAFWSVSIWGLEKR